MYNGLIQTTIPGWRLIREDIRHPADGSRCDLLQNEYTGVYGTSDGCNTIRTIAPNIARRLRRQMKSAG